MLNKLLTIERGLVFLSAPTNGGKTATIKEITKRKEKAIAISGEKLTDAILQKLKEDKTDLLTDYAQYQCICVEDLDWYKGREHTQYEFAAALSQFAESALVIVTGVDLKNRLAKMFSRLNQYTYFEKKDANGDWL